MLRWFLSRLRGYMQAEIMIELNRLRSEMARRDEMEPLVKQMEAALLTIALHAEERNREE
jgi:hypothetical protein